MRRLIALLLLLAISPIRAEPLRVTTWNLNFSPATPADARRLVYIASVLESLNTDVIMLQGLPDRAACERLAAFLSPSRYHVAACSAFPNSSGQNLHQVAILTKKPVAAAWTESWKPEGMIAPPGGLVCAAIRHGAGLVAVYSVHLKDVVSDGGSERETQVNILTRELSAAQLARHAGSLEARLAYHAAIIIAGSLNTNPDQPQFEGEHTLKLLEEAGFKNAFTGAPLKDRITRRGSGQNPDATVDYVFAREGDFLGGPRIIASELSSHHPVTCDVVIPLAVADAETSPTRLLRIHWRWLAPALAALLLLSVLGWHSSRKRFYSPAQITTSRIEGLLSFPDEAKDPLGDGGFQLEIQSPPSALQIPDPASDTTRARIQSLEKRAFAAEQKAARATALVRMGLVPYLGRLMKDTLFRGVAAQRAQLLAVQHAAAVQVAEMERRMAKIQSQLQSRLTTYERRIAELEKEVAAKDQVNRELLKAKIQMMKQVLEAKRPREEDETQVGSNGVTE